MTKLAWPRAQSAVSLFTRQLLSSPSSMFGSTLRYNPNIFEISPVRDVRCLSRIQRPPSEDSTHGHYLLIKSTNGEVEAKIAKETATCQQCKAQFEKGDALKLKFNCGAYLIHKHCAPGWFTGNKKCDTCEMVWVAEPVTLHTVEESAERPKSSRKWGGLLGCFRG